MDDREMIKESLSQLYNFLAKELHVDLPLCWNNPNKSIRISFETVDVPTAKAIAQEIIGELFADAWFWACEYGSTTGETFIKHGLLKETSSVVILPYHSELVDPEWFEYDHDAIACVQTRLKRFDVDAYTDYCFSLAFLSNSIYLVSLKRKCVVAIYDSRGMDIATTDESMLQQMCRKYAGLTILLSGSND